MLFSSLSKTFDAAGVHLMVDDRCERRGRKGPGCHASPAGRELGGRGGRSDPWRSELSRNAKGDGNEGLGNQAPGGK